MLIFANIFHLLHLLEKTRSNIFFAPGSVADEVFGDDRLVVGTGSVGSVGGSRVRIIHFNDPFSGLVHHNNDDDDDHDDDDQGDEDAEQASNTAALCDGLVLFSLVVVVVFHFNRAQSFFNK